VSEEHEDEPVETPRVPADLLAAFNDCVSSFRECTAELRATRTAFSEHRAFVEARLDDMRTIALRIEVTAQATDRGVQGLRDLIDQDYASLRDMILSLTTRVDGTSQLAASAYDLGESLTRKLRQAGVINGNETGRNAGSSR
jgi:hypothetical protein